MGWNSQQQLFTVLVIYIKNIYIVCEVLIDKILEFNCSKWGTRTSSKRLVVFLCACSAALCRPRGVTPLGFHLRAALSRDPSLMITVCEIMSQFTGGVR